MYVPAMLILAVCAVGPAVISAGSIAVPTEWKSMEEDCVSGIVDTLKGQHAAVVAYDAMVTHFSHNSKYVALFNKSAVAEFERATELQDYLAMRGVNKAVFKSTPDDFRAEVTSWESAAEAVSHALSLTQILINEVRTAIKKCESGDDDFHAVYDLTVSHLGAYHMEARSLATRLAKLIA